MCILTHQSVIAVHRRPYDHRRHWRRTTRGLRPVNTSRRQFLARSAQLGVLLGVGYTAARGLRRRLDRREEDRADRRRAAAREAGPLRLVQLRRLRQPRRGRRLRGEVRREGRDHHVRHRQRGDHQARRPARSKVDLHHSVAVTTLVQADRRRADPAAQQDLPHQLRQRRERRSTTRGTTRAASTRAVHVLRHRASASAPTGSTRRRSRSRVGTRSGTHGVQRRQPRCSTTTARRSRWRCCARVSPTSTPATGRHQAGPRRPHRADRSGEHQGRHRGLHTTSPRASTIVAHTWSGDMIGGAVGLPARGHGPGGARLLAPADRPSASSPTTAWA